MEQNPKDKPKVGGIEKGAISLGRLENNNVRKIELGKVYPMEDIELMFDARLGEQLKTMLKKHFEYTIDNGKITFTKKVG